MKSRRDDLKKLLELLDITEPSEINCEEFLSRASEFIERDERIAKDDEFLHHLRVCPECLEEFCALYRALRNKEWRPNAR